MSSTGPSSRRPESSSYSDDIPVTIHLTSETLKLLEDMAYRRGTDLAGVIGHAISLENWYEDVKRRNGRILVDDGRGLKEVTFG